MDGYRLPPPSTLTQLSNDDCVTVLQKLFEHSDVVGYLSEIVKNVPVQSYDELISRIKEELETWSRGEKHSDKDGQNFQARERLHELLSAHPRLGAKNVDSEQSKAEQAHLQSDSPDSEKLLALNQEYEKAFDGVRYVTFVNGRPMSEILADMQMRIDRGNVHQEHLDGIAALCEIASDRARKLSSAPS